MMRPVPRVEHPRSEGWPSDFARLMDSAARCHEVRKTTCDLRATHGLVPLRVHPGEHEQLDP